MACCTTARGRKTPAAFAAAKDHVTAGQDNRIGAGHSPAWHGAAAGEHRHGGFLSGFKSVALGADGYGRQSNQLVFDDTAGRLRAQLATDAAATQLNLGHLIHQADNYRGSFRGTGLGIAHRCLWGGPGRQGIADDDLLRQRPRRPSGSRRATMQRAWPC